MENIHEDEFEEEILDEQEQQDDLDFVSPDLASDDWDDADDDSDSSDEDEDESDSDGSSDAVRAEDDEVFQSIKRKAIAKGTILPVHSGKRWELEEATDYATNSVAKMQLMGTIDDNMLLKIGEDPEYFSDTLEEYFVLQEMDVTDAYIRLLATEEIKQTDGLDDMSIEEKQNLFSDLVNDYQNDIQKKLKRTPSFINTIHATIDSLEDPRTNVIDAVNHIRAQEMEQAIAAQRVKIRSDADEVVKYATQGRATFNVNNKPIIISTALHKMVEDKAEVARYIHMSYEVVQDTVNGEAVTTIAMFKRMEDPAYVAHLAALDAYYNANVFKNLAAKQKQQVIQTLSKKPSLLKGINETESIEYLSPQKNRK